MNVMIPLVSAALLESSRRVIGGSTMLGRHFRRAGMGFRQASGSDLQPRKAKTGRLKTRVDTRCFLQPGDIQVVLEAMKMETNITAPRAGKVAALKVSEGDSVQVGQVVVEFES